MTPDEYILLHYEPAATCNYLNAVNYCSFRTFPAFFNDPFTICALTQELEQSVRVCHRGDWTLLMQRKTPRRESINQDVSAPG